MLALPAAAKERPGELDTRRELQKLGGELLEIGATFGRYAAAASSKASYDLLYEQKEANEFFFHVYHVRTILDLAMAVEAPDDERTVRSVLVREANDLVALLDGSIEDRPKAKIDLPKPEYVRTIDAFLVKLQQIREAARRLAKAED